MTSRAACLLYPILEAERGYDDSRREPDYNRLLRQQGSHYLLPVGRLNIRSRQFFPFDLQHRLTQFDTDTIHTLNRIHNALSPRALAFIETMAREHNVNLLSQHLLLTFAHREHIPLDDWNRISTEYTLYIEAYALMWRPGYPN